MTYFKVASFLYRCERRSKTKLIIDSKANQITPHMQNIRTKLENAMRVVLIALFICFLHLP